MGFIQGLTRSVRETCIHVFLAIHQCEKRVFTFFTSAFEKIIQILKKFFLENFFFRKLDEIHINIILKN